MIYAIGDVHGEADALRQMLAMLPVHESDIVIFLGDLINRGGLNPYDCVEQVIAFDRCRKVCLMGNHEETMLYYLEEGSNIINEGMDAANTFASYVGAGYPVRAADPMSIPESHRRFYYQAEPWTLPFYVTETHIFTHAGWDLSQPVQKQSLHRLHWGGVTGYETPVMSQTVVRGHTPMPKVTFSRAKHAIYLDTGCGLGGYLSAVSFPGDAVYNVKPQSYRANWYSRMRR